MQNIILLMVEEVLPFIFFVRNKRKKLNQIQAGGVSEEKIREYSTLSIEKLNCRLSEEHERAIKIDEKTAKFTLGLSVSLTILSTASGALAKLLPDNDINSTIIFLCGLSSVFMLIAGIISLGALKTLPKYGYGTIHELRAEEKEACYLAKVLILQEDINIVRHLRNEAAYQCLRNGFFLLLVALITSIFLIRIPVEKKHDVNSSKSSVVAEKNIQTKDNNSEKEKVIGKKVESANLTDDRKENSDNKSIQATGKSAAPLR